MLTTLKIGEINSVFWGDVSLLGWFSSPLSLPGAADAIYIHYFLLSRPVSYCHQLILRSEHWDLQKSLTNFVQISILIQIKKMIFKGKQKNI